MIIATRSYQFDAAEFDLHYSRLEAGLLADVIRLVEFVQLNGFTSNMEQVTLPDGLVLRPMTDPQMSQAIQALAVPAEFSGGANTVQVSRFHQWALTTEQTHPIHSYKLGMPERPCWLIRRRAESRVGAAPSVDLLWSMIGQRSPFPRSRPQYGGRDVDAAAAVAADPGGDRAGGAGRGRQGPLPAGDADPRRAGRAVRRCGVRRSVRGAGQAGVVAGTVGAGHGAADGRGPDRPGGGAAGAVRDGLEIRAGAGAGRSGVGRLGVVRVPHPSDPAWAGGAGAGPAACGPEGQGTGEGRREAAHRFHPRAGGGSGSE